MSDGNDDLIQAIANQKTKNPNISVTGLSDFFKKVANKVDTFLLMRRVNKKIAAAKPKPK